jgi:hypothetical protein
MTSVEEVRAALTSSGSQIWIAGVPWPLYKLAALVVGLLIFAVVGMLTAEAGPAVLTAAATSTVIWLVFGLRRNPRG